MSEVVGNPLANLLKGVIGYWQPTDTFLRGIGNFKIATFVKLQLIPSDSLPEDIDNPLEQLAKGIG